MWRSSSCSTRSSSASTVGNRSRIGAPRRAARVGRRDPGEVALVDRAVALVAAADLVPAGGAAVVLVDRARACLGNRLPDDLVEDDAPAARGAPAGVLLAEPDLERRLLARRGGDRLERGVEVADVGRPEDDLGQQPGERARLERGRPTLAVDRRARHPATAAVEIDHHVAEARMGLDPGGDELGWRGWRQAAECREREPRLAPDRNLATRHGRHPATVEAFRRVNAGPLGDVPLGDSIRIAAEATRDRRRSRQRRRRPSEPGSTGRRARAPSDRCARRPRRPWWAAEEPLRLLDDRAPRRGPRAHRGRPGHRQDAPRPGLRRARSGSASAGSREPRTCSRAT